MSSNGDIYLCALKQKDGEDCLRKFCGQSPLATWGVLLMLSRKDLTVKDRGGLAFKYERVEVAMT